MSQAVQGVILDIDGTLVDSNDAHARAWVEAFAELGITAPYEEIRRRIGKGGDKLMPEVSGVEEDSPRGHQISKRRREIFKARYLPNLRPTPGAKELLHHMKTRGLKLVVATSAKKDEVDSLLKVCGGNDVIGSKTSSDDADHSKPDPDIVHVALQEIGLAPDRVLMLGDTPYDVEAAGRAGVGVIAFRCGGWHDAGLNGAVAVYEHPADLLANYDESPLAG